MSVRNTLTSRNFRTLTDEERIGLAENLEEDILRDAKWLIEKTIRERPECLDLEAIPHLTDAERIELAERPGIYGQVE